MSSGLVFDLRRYAVHDGPGIRTAVFLKGCPLQCAWCHNPEGLTSAPELVFRPQLCIRCEDCLAACPEGAIQLEPGSISVDRARCRLRAACVAACPSEALALAGREMTVEAVMGELERDRVFYDQSGGGVTFTGGEPLAQAAFLGGLLRACRERALRTALDTSGFAPWAVLEELHGLVDLFLYDLKLMEADRHREWTGVSNETILANLERLARAGSTLLIRIPLIPGVNDDEDNLRRSGEFLSSLPLPPPVELLPYHPLAEGKYAALGRAPRWRPEAGRLAERDRAAAILAGYGLELRGAESLPRPCPPVALRPSLTRSA